MLQFSCFTHVLMLVRAPPAELVEKHRRLMTHHPTLKQTVDTGAPPPQSTHAGDA